MLAQALEGAQQHRQALALDGLADERDPQAAGGAGGARRRDSAGTLDAVGDDVVAAAEEAARGPGGGLGDGDAAVQAAHPAPGAHRARGAVGDGVRAVGVEGADERGAVERRARPS